MSWFRTDTGMPEYEGDYYCVLRETFTDKQEEHTFNYVGKLKAEKAKGKTVFTAEYGAGVQVRFENGILKREWEDGMSVEVTHWKQMPRLPREIPLHTVKFPDDTSAKAYIERKKLKFYKLEACGDGRYEVTPAENK